LKKRADEEGDGDPTDPAVTAKYLPPFTLLAMAAALVLGGCASAPSGVIAGVKVPADATVAIFSTPVLPYDGFDVNGKFLDFLRSSGLTPTSIADSTFVLRIGFKQADPSPVECTITLLQDGKTVLTAAGTSAAELKLDPDASGEREREAAERASAFEAAARSFEARAR